MNTELQYYYYSIRNIMSNETIHCNNACFPPSGALPHMWEESIKRRCNRTNGRLCSIYFENNLTLIIGCVSFLCAFFLLGFLVWDRRRKKSKRFLYLHDSILFVSRFLILFGTHQFVFCGIEWTSGTTPMGMASSPVATVCLVIPLATYTIWSWKNERKLSNNIVVSDGNGPSSDSTNNSSIIILQAKDIFQDFLNTTTASASATSVAQIMLLVIYSAGVAESIKDRYPTAFATPTISEIYPALLVSCIITSAYSVGVGDVFGRFHSVVYFWLDAISFVQKVTHSKFIYVSSTEDMIEKKLKQSYDPDKMKILKGSIYVRATISIIVNMFGQFFITIALPTRYVLLFSILLWEIC